MEEILTPDQVSQILQIHPFTVLKFIKQGKLKASKLGRVYRIRKSDVDQFLDDLANKASQKASLKKEAALLPKELESPKPPQPESQKASLKNFSPDSFVTNESSEGLTEETPESHPPHHEDHYVIHIKP